MKKTTKIVAVSVLAAIILLGIGYAAITNINLQITGRATATASQDNFSVEFTNVESVFPTGNNEEGKPYVDAQIVQVPQANNAPIAATIEVAPGVLTQAGQSATATFEVTNTSELLSAEFDLNIREITEDVAVNYDVLNEYFEITADFADEDKILAAGDTSTVTVSVNLIKTPIDIDEIVCDVIQVDLIATPIQPEA